MALEHAAQHSSGPAPAAVSHNRQRERACRIHCGSYSKATYVRLLQIHRNGALVRLWWWPTQRRQVRRPAARAAG